MNSEIADRRDQEAVNSVVDDEYRALAVPREGNVDVFGENSANTTNATNEAGVDDIRQIRLAPLCDRNSLREMVRSLNDKQQYFAHVLHNIKNNSKFFEYVGGGQVLVNAD